MKSKSFANFTHELKNGERQYANRGDSSLDKFNSSNGQVYGTLTLDTRRMLDDGTYPVAVRVAYEGKSIYLRVGNRYTKEEWIELCECEKLARNKKSSERKELKAKMDKVASMVDQMLEDGSFSLQRLKDMFQGKKIIETDTIYSIWEAFIEEKTGQKKAGTARCSRDILSRFKRDMGENVALQDINRTFILTWVKVMAKKGLSVTSIGISLRTFRTIVNICIDRGLIKGNTKEMFKTRDITRYAAVSMSFLMRPQ